MSRRGALTGCVLVAALVLVGCAATTSTPTTSGPPAIYISDPAGLTPSQQDVVDAEQLACDQQKATVTCQTRHHAKISDNARDAIKDTTHAIAYVGEVVPGSSADSVGITNAEDLLQVSPTDSATAVTRKSPSIPGSPQHFYESFSTYGQTFARVVPSTQHEAVALLAEMRDSGVKRLYVQPDGTDYGKVLSSEIDASEAGQGITPASSPSGADAVLFAGSSRGEAAPALDSAVTSNPRLKLFVPSALADPAFTAILSPAAQRVLYASTPGLTTVPTTFLANFRAMFGHDPAPQAVFGYAAMQMVLDALRTAGSKANDRGTVVGDVIRHTFSDTVLGSFSIDRYGDTSLASFLIERVKAGRLVTVKALQG